MRRNRVMTGLFVGLMAVGSTGAVMPTVSTITEDDLGTTVATNVVGALSGIAISTDVGAPAGLGAGSLQLATEDDNAARAEVSLAVGMPLAGLADVSYSTFQPTGSSQYAAVALKLGVTSDEGFTTLVFEPYWQDGLGGGAPIVANQWQLWENAELGTWWSSGDPGGLEKGYGGPPFYTLAEADAALTNATVAYWQLGIGSYNRDWTVYADGLTIDGTMFDFEPAPLTKDDCKKGGWQSITGPNSEEFRNQGDCVSFFSSNGKSRG